METPVFRLGLVGFKGAEEQLLRDSVAEYRRIDWHCGPAEGADAWLINGARVARIQDSRVRVIASEGTVAGSALLLDVSSRPTAFAVPAPELLRDVVPFSFEPRQVHSVVSCLAKLEVELARLRRAYWIASHLVQSGATVGRAAYELRTGRQLLAVADMKGKVSVLPEVTAEQIERASWIHRARKLVEAPADFEQHVLAELLWTYSTRTRLDLLPARYTETQIYLRRAPRVPTHWIADAHLQAIRELAAGPATFAELHERLDMDEKFLGRTLAALYHVGSITTNPERAWAGSTQAAMLSTRADLLEDGALTSRTRDGMPSTTPLV